MSGILDDALAVSENIDLGNVAVIILITLVSAVVLIGVCSGLFGALIRWIRKMANKDRRQSE